MRNSYPKLYNSPKYLRNKPMWGWKESNACSLYPVTNKHIYISTKSVCLCVYMYMCTQTHTQTKYELWCWFDIFWSLHSDYDWNKSHVYSRCFHTTSLHYNEFNKALNRRYPRPLLVTEMTQILIVNSSELKQNHFSLQRVCEHELNWHATKLSPSTENRIYFTSALCAYN